MFVSFDSFCFSFRRGCPSILEKVQCFGHSRHHFRPDVPVLLHLFVSEASGPVGGGGAVAANGTRFQETLQNEFYLYKYIYIYILDMNFETFLIIVLK